MIVRCNKLEWSLLSLTATAHSEPGEGFFTESFNCCQLRMRSDTRESAYLSAIDLTP